MRGDINIYPDDFGTVGVLDPWNGSLVSNQTEDRLSEDIMSCDQFLSSLGFAVRSLSYSIRMLGIV